MVYSLDKTMQDITEKQVAEWKEELVRQVQTRDNAQKELDAANININALQGGIQFGELLLKKNESLGQQSNIMGQVPESKPKSARTKWQPT